MFTTLSPTNEMNRTQTREWMMNTAVSTAQSIVHHYTPITLQEMADIALLNRTDTKFVMRTSTLLTALRHLNKDYRVLEVDGMRLHPYQTLFEHCQKELSLH